MLNLLNAVLAAILIIGGTAAGFYVMHDHTLPAIIIGTAVGLLIGSIVAATLCGALATLLLIENHLRNIRAAT
ncbi:hypothetical protein X731_16350 [Mesorhizobium sp. L2C054A000]|nr:hypothetical protein X731_16350 [Mesorhizobium sp. L2C054A000]